MWRGHPLVYVTGSSPSPCDGAIIHPKTMHLRSTTHFPYYLMCDTYWCGGLLPNVICSFSGARCIRWPGFALIRLSCCIIDVMLLHCVCCTRLDSNSNHCLLSELLSTSLRVRHTRAAASSHPLEFKISRCRTSQFARCSCLPRLVCGMTFPALCLAHER